MRVRRGSRTPPPPALLQTIQFIRRLFPRGPLGGRRGRGPPRAELCAGAVGLRETRVVPRGDWRSREDEAVTDPQAGGRPGEAAREDEGEFNGWRKCSRPRPQLERRAGGGRAGVGKAGWGPRLGAGLSLRRSAPPPPRPVVEVALRLPGRLGGVLWRLAPAVSAPRARPGGAPAPPPLRLLPSPSPYLGHSRAALRF